MAQSLTASPRGLRCGTPRIQFRRHWRTIQLSLSGGAEAREAGDGRRGQQDQPGLRDGHPRPDGPCPPAGHRSPFGGGLQKVSSHAKMPSFPKLPWWWVVRGNRAAGPPVSRSWLAQFCGLGLCHLLALNTHPRSLPVAQRFTIAGDNSPCAKLRAKSP